MVQVIIKAVKINKFGNVDKEEVEIKKHKALNLRKLTDSEIPEWTVIELQGDLESKSNATSLNGKFIGDLLFSKKAEPMLIIGHHIMVGKVVTMEKPLAVIVKNQDENLPTSQSQATEEVEMDDTESADANDSVSYTVQSIIKRKIIFKTRPKPIISNVPKKL